MRWGAQCWMLKPLLLNKWTISQLCRFLFAFWGWGLSLCEVSSMLMSDASLSKAYKSGLCRSQNGKWFWSEITHTCHRLIIVVKPESLWRVGTILSQPRLLHHHRADTTKSIWFLFREMLLPSTLSLADVLGVIYICWHLPRRIDFTRSFCLLFHPTF